MTRKPYSHKRIYIGRLPNGIDLIGSITRIANEEGIKLATVTVHGLISRLVLTIFNQETKIAEPIEYESGMEIAAMSGTVSQFKGRSLARLSGVLARADGTLVGGSIALGTTVFACEVVMIELEGGTLSRDFDMATGLPLWKESSLLIDEGS